MHFRRIIAAELQAIVYKEYLPITLANETMTKFQLSISNEGERTTYDPSIDPTTVIEFATGAFRFGHSLINSRVTGRPLDITQGYENLRDLFFRPFGLYEGTMGPLMEEVTTNPPQQFDRYLVRDVTHYLYRYFPMRDIFFIYLLIFLMHACVFQKFLLCCIL